MLPGAQAFDGFGVLDDGNPSVLCLLGAAWVHQDFIHRVLALKRQFGTRFVMTVHDLIPIYARETCDQDTARVFEEFMRRALRHADHILSVSENTAKDLRRYAQSLQISEPEGVGDGGAVVPRRPLNLRPDGRGVRRAQLDLDETQAPRGARGELPEPILRLSPSIDGESRPSRGQHEIEGQIPNEDVARVEHVRIATLERQDAEEHHQRCES